MRGFFNLCLFSILTLASFGCAPLSEEEKKERREDAFDLSGSYSTKIEGTSEVEAQLKISNVKGRHLINVTLNRTSPLTGKEIEVLGKHQIDVGPIQAAFVNKTLTFVSRGSQVAEWNGGDNVSSDNGKSSQFALCASESVAGIQTAAGNTASVTYCLSGIAGKESPVRIKGSLELMITIYKRIAQPNGSFDTQIVSDRATMQFMTAGGKAFSDQYMGRWTGKIFAEANVYFSSAVGVDLVKDGAAFYAYPIFREVSIDSVAHVRKDVIQLNETGYAFEKVEENTSELEGPFYPVIRMVYKQQAGSDRLVFIGTIWSLGDFSGNILLIGSGSERKVGSFKFSRSP